MNTFEKLFPENLYHSYVVEGDVESTTALLVEFLQNREKRDKGVPDILCQTYESFGMDNTGDIREWHSRKGLGGKKICIIATKFINREAEQSLLKIIEEPADNAHMFIVVPDSSILLDTIISRVHVVKNEKGENNGLKKLATSFTTLSPKGRIEVIAKIIKENKDEENSGQLRFYATAFVNELEIIFHRIFKKNRSDNKARFILEELQKSREYLSTPGASVKMILEHLALVI